MGDHSPHITDCTSNEYGHPHTPESRHTAPVPKGPFTPVQSSSVKAASTMSPLRSLQMTPFADLHIRTRKRRVLLYKEVTQINLVQDQCVTSSLPGPCPGEDPSVGRLGPWAVDLELGQAQVDVGPERWPGAAAQFIQGVGDVSDDETHADAALGQDTAGAAAAQVAEVARSSVEGVCRGGGEEGQGQDAVDGTREGSWERVGVWGESAVEDNKGVST
jgi:hypothetical protein